MKTTSEIDLNLKYKTKSGRIVTSIRYCGDRHEREFPLAVTLGKSKIVHWYSKKGRSIRTDKSVVDGSWDLVPHKDGNFIQTDKPELPKKLTSKQKDAKIKELQDQALKHHVEMKKMKGTIEAVKTAETLVQEKDAKIEILTANNLGLVTDRNEAVDNINVNHQNEISILKSEVRLFKFGTISFGVIAAALVSMQLATAFNLI